MNSLAFDVLSTLFPRICPLCCARFLNEREAFCPVCLSDFRPLRPPWCGRCGSPLQGCTTDGEAICPACVTERSGTEFLGYQVRSAAVYTGDLRRAVLKMKYNGRVDLSVSLGQYLDQQMDRLYPEGDFQRVIPVPLHPKRTRERGFNQCVLLARTLAKRRSILLDDRSAQRIRHTPSQIGSQRAERRKNLKNAFRVKRSAPIRGSSVLVLDDVYTTGATLESLAEALHQAGARRVCGITLARSPERVMI